MNLGKREFLIATGTTVTGALGAEILPDTSDELEIHADLDRMPENVDGHDLYANIYAHADYSEEQGLERLELQQLKPGEQEWDILEAEEPVEKEGSIAKSYNPEDLGEYSFRAVAYTDEETYISETENLEVVEEL